MAEKKKLKARQEKAKADGIISEEKRGQPVVPFFSFYIRRPLSE